MWVSYVKTPYRLHTLGYYKSQYDALISLNTKRIENLQMHGNVMEI
jgi:hypothetical protein